jgi:hypothetical protein
VVNTTTTFVDAFLLSIHSDFLLFALDALSNLKAIHMNSWRELQYTMVEYPWITEGPVEIVLSCISSVK